MNRPYNPHCLVGNWYEDRVLEEDLIKDFLAKKNSGNLKNQQHDSSLNSVQNVTLTTVSDGGVHFGDIIVLKCDGTDENKQDYVAKAARKDCYIAGNFQNSGPEDVVKAIGLSSPVVNSSTALVVRSIDGSQNGIPVRFGQPFALSTVDGNFYLHSSIRTYDRSSKRAHLQELDFIGVYNHECDWVATCVDPKFRMEVEGRFLPSNEKLVILNMKTNKAIGVVTDFTNSARFEPVCHTFLNSHKAEEDVNHWRLVTNVPQVLPY